MLVERFNYRKCTAYNLDDATSTAILISRAGAIQFVKYESIDAEAEYVDDVELPQSLLDLWANEQNRREALAERNVELARLHREESARLRILWLECWASMSADLRDILDNADDLDRTAAAMVESVLELAPTE